MSSSWNSHLYQISAYFLMKNTTICSVNMLDFIWTILTKSCCITNWTICENFTAAKNVLFIAPFNNMRTVKFKAQPTNLYFATINQMSDGSFQLLRLYCHALFHCLNCAQRFDYCVLVVIGSSDELSNIWVTVAKNAVVGGASNFGVFMLLKSAVYGSLMF